MSLIPENLCLPCIKNPLPQPLIEFCDLVRLKGGIKQLVFKKCNVQFEDITDIDEWKQLIANGDIAFTPYGKGNTVDAQTTNKRFVACGVEEISSRIQGFDFEDYNSDCELYEDVQFYNFLKEKYRYLDVGFITCDNRFYGWVGAGTYSYNHDTTIEDNNQDGYTYHKSEIRYNKFLSIVPVNIDLSPLFV